MIRAFLASLGFVFTVSASAAIVVDQQQLIETHVMAYFSQPDLAQSFQQSSGNIAGAGILLRSAVGTTDLVTIGVWTALPNAGGTQLASASATGTAGQWVDVFWTPVSTVVNTTYYLVFSGNTTLAIAGSTNNPYLSGQTYANEEFFSYPTFDYTFRTYSDDAWPSQVPDSGSTLAIFALSLIGLHVVRSRLAASGNRV
jgi:hypothetical protein